MNVYKSHRVLLVVFFVFFQGVLLSQEIGKTNTDESFPNMLYSTGVKFYNEGRYELAFKVWSKIYTLFPDYTKRDKVIFGIANIYFKMKNFEKAKQCYEYILDHYPEFEYPLVVFIALDKIENYSDEKHMDSNTDWAVSDSSNMFKKNSNESNDVEPLNINNHTSPSYVSDEVPFVSNVFVETDLRQALLDISSQTGVKIIADNTVQGYVSVEFDNVPLPECLKLMLEPLGFTYHKIENYYVVGLAVPDNPSFPLLSDTEVIKLNYLRAEDIENMLSDYYNDVIKINKRLNNVTITASREIIDKLKRDIQRIDTPSKKIMIEVLVTEILEEASYDIGIDWNISATRNNRTFNLTTNLHDEQQTSDNLTAELTRLAIPYKKYTIDAISRLNALIRSGKAQIRANPKVASLEGQEAEFFMGKEEYHTIVTGPVNYPYTTLQKIDAGISLKITPYISNKNEIALILESEVSDISGKGSTGLPVVSRRSVKTDIITPNGNTIVIGGLKSENEQIVEKKVPILGSLPILGAIFRNNEKIKMNTEVLIFLTPKILE